MTTPELTKKIKKDFSSITDEEIDSVDFSLGSPSENLKSLMDNPAMRTSKAVNDLVNATFRSFIKECRDIVIKESESAKK